MSVNSVMFCLIAGEGVEGRVPVVVVYLSVGYVISFWGKGAGSSRGSQEVRRLTVVHVFFRDEATM